MVAPAASAPDYPLAANGKRNFSRAAVFPGQAAPSRETIPQGGFGFGDLIDIINPLQHIPIIGHIYRALTGDALNAGGRILGGLLYGGPMGFMAGVGGSMMAETGASERALAEIFGDGNTPNALMSKAYTARTDAHVKSGLDIQI